jgi:hypothetical protein
MKRRLLVLCALAAAACGQKPTPSTVVTDPGTVVTVDWTDAQKAELAALRAKTDEAAALTADAFAARHAVPFRSALGYEPTSALGYDKLAGSPFALSEAEKVAFAAQGFVIGKSTFPHFGYGYDTIFLKDLPVYITADALLFAVHKSYDAILMALEEELLRPTLETLLGRMQSRLASGALTGQTAKDADLYVAVALGLLRGQAVAPVAGADAGKTNALVQAATAAKGTADVELFGATRKEDFSQFLPRGHYTKTEALGRYFQSMMWLGRVDFRLLETQSDGKQIFRRRQVEGALGLRSLLDDGALAAWRRIDDVLTTFVGEQDFMSVAALDQLAASAGATTQAALGQVSDAALLEAVRQHGLGSQRIASQLIVNGTDASKPLPLNVSFTLLGQRYTLDSHVLANVTYGRTKAMRMMPSSLDVGFAVFENPVAVPLLAPELTKYAYAPNLESMRVLAEAHGPTYDESSITRLWQASIRELSPKATELDAKAKGLPAVATTEPWARRLLGAQLASWAEVRHDTILYAKQSYTDMAACEFPDAYVDPYPAFYERLGVLAGKGRTLVERVTEGANVPSQSRMVAFFDELASVARRLGTMAQEQREGKPFTTEELAFVNEMVSKKSVGCTAEQVQFYGWYSKLFFDRDSMPLFEPTIADVHTQPTDEAGAEVGRVLHVGTGFVRPLVTTVDTCVGPRVYVGIVSSFHEVVTEKYERLQDGPWAERVKKGVAQPAWVPTVQ